MGHHETNENISPAEKKFQELMHNGEDFFKIEIYRSALKYYKEAAKLGVDNDLASRKVAECERLLSNERKWIYIIASIAAILVVLVWILQT